MAKNTLVLISGSPSASSRSQRVLEAVGVQLEASHIETRLYTLGNFDPASLLNGDTTNANLRRYIEDVSASDGIVVATPVYKGTFAGTLKVLLDVIPPEALVNKLALGIATARNVNHLDGARAGLAGIFDFFRVQVQAAPLLLTDDGLLDAHTSDKLSASALTAVEEAAERVRSLLRLKQSL